MGNSVYAEGMGYFHKGSGGKGVAPGDACLTPPPPPGGPLPVPYVNMLSAADLAKGSKTVKVQGEPTALENASHVSTSTGNEPATQGGGVITHKTKGKGHFSIWSFVVKAEGKGVARHGDMMEQNTASPLPNCVDSAAFVNFLLTLTENQMRKDCPPYEYSKHYTKTTRSQRRKVKKKPCWECQRDLENYRKRKKTPENDKLIAEKERRIKNQKSGKEKPMIADHQPPQSVAWEMGGCHMRLKTFKKRMRKLFVRPHCEEHSSAQGTEMGKLDRQEIYDAMNANVPGLNI
ncbi:DUF4150 domain-containing protein [Amaricoccus sp.]|uniref:DUF4150 domain-containing protein n=1 Tax=Amaricoccus sp. TaxID=1872485 RepID=UPI001B3E607A|nr:DUF4150 domain-containing protein [Amaricoccus sp.]MBP7241249.1 DUF4150 domain-containing protein [Amaricoccus sp.]